MRPGGSRPSRRPPDGQAARGMPRSTRIFRTARTVRGLDRGRYAGSPDPARPTIFSSCRRRRRTSVLAASVCANAREAKAPWLMPRSRRGVTADRTRSAPWAPFVAFDLDFADHLGKLHPARRPTAERLRSRDPTNAEWKRLSRAARCRRALSHDRGALARPRFRADGRVSTGQRWMRSSSSPIRR